MTRIHWVLPVIIFAFTVFHADNLFGRGGGGFHGGGGGGHIGRGNLGGGNLGGARPGGNFGGGNLSGLNRPGGGNLGGGNFGGGNFGGGNLGGGDFGGGHSGGPGLGQFDLGSKGGGGGKSNGPGLGDFSLGSKGGGGGLDGKGFPGNSSKGFTGKGSANGNPFGGNSGEGPDKNQLGNFLGLPSDSGMNSLRKNTHLNNTHLNNTKNNLVRINNTQLNNRANYTRDDFRRNGYNSFYSNNWYRRYPNAWRTNYWAYGNMWSAASLVSMTSWFNYGNTQPIYYDYGNNVTYQDDSVYMNGQDIGTSQQYYQQAETLASTGAQAQPNDEEKWMPLGVFAMTHDQHNKANLILQLAVNKEGIIRGNYTATLTNDTQPVQGSVDKKTQRAAWTIGKNKETVFETGIYNLTKAEAPTLVHFGADKIEQWLLVRQQQSEKEGEGSSKD